MANYNCAIRTNYFNVKNAETFEAFMSRVYGSEESVEVWSKTDEDGRTKYAFGCYGGIAGLCDVDEDPDEIDDSAYDAFINGLQEHVAENDAVIIFEVGNENLRYVVGSAEIITSNDCKYISIQDLATKQTAEMLQNPEWKTQCD